MKVDELKYGEEYYEKTFHGNIMKFKMGSDGNLYWKIDTENGTWKKEEASLLQILNFRFEKIEKQFPQIGDNYYVIGMIGGQHLSIMGFEWRDSKADHRMLKVGNVFETVEEAKETEQKIIDEVLKK